MSAPPTTELAPHQVAFLEPPRVAVVATVGEDGMAHQSTVWYRPEPDGTLMLNSRVARRWSRDIRRTGEISIAVVDAEDGYRWLGLRCKLASIDDDRARALGDIMALHRRYHDGAAGPEVEASYGAHPRVTFYVRPVRVHDHLGDE